MATSSPIQIPILHKGSLQKPFSKKLSSPNRCAITDRHKKGRRMVRAYVAQNVRDSFATLGISPGTSKQEIKSAYRRLALQYHPDVCKDDGCGSKFKQIKTAYEHAMNVETSLFGRNMDEFNYDSSSISYEGLMGVNDDSWEDWEEWMGWEGAGTRDYTSHINIHL
ncbi:hypothetical protein O6H91_16G042600 [Diphasiastrum complanatum]|uniref:Uncharacterized protein n=2 Tax=Diphasiastrum complanatum TaxID=34168 RepID=A0ACC2BBQ7_DIPCM|nr:hypothetical protein O6H91_16G042500 [Diphasiastrum complanatum]KAJ7527209.1 hypothetical protein O6H91_16G042600 [Diphasiastrum complanatum]